MINDIRANDYQLAQPMNSGQIETGSTGGEAERLFSNPAWAIRKAYQRHLRAGRAYPPEKSSLTLLFAGIYG
jgi:hypothetical protein